MSRLSSYVVLGPLFWEHTTLRLYLICPLFLGMPPPQGFTLHLINGWVPDSTMASLWAPYFRNVPTLESGDLHYMALHESRCTTFWERSQPLGFTNPKAQDKAKHYHQPINILRSRCLGFLCLLIGIKVHSHLVLGTLVLSCQTPC
jgi:hypothetical protein